MCPVWCICFDHHTEPQGDLTKHFLHELLSHVSHTTDIGLKDSKSDDYSLDLKRKFTGVIRFYFKDIFTVH